MNKYILLLVLFISPVQAQEWTKTDTALEVTYLTLHVADWAQSRSIADSDGKFIETNPFLGNRPSDSEVNRYFLISGIIHAGIAYYLPDKWRKGFQLVTIGFEAGVVSKNYNLGIKFMF